MKHSRKPQNGYSLCVDNFMVSECSRSSLSPAGPPTQLHLPVGNIYCGSCSPLCLSPPSMVWSYLLLEHKKPLSTYGHELGKTLGNSEVQGSLVCCSSWGCEELDITWGLKNNTFPGLIRPLLLITDPIPSRT